MKRILTITATVLLCIIATSCRQNFKGSPKSNTVLSKYTNDYDGIDVSHHQGDIDWRTVAKDTNIRFVYIKATEGKTYIDKKYNTNIEQARKAGLLVGSYHYFRMTSTPKEQFEHIKRNIDKNEQDLIPMIDVETSDNKNLNAVRSSLKELIDMVEAHYGKKPLIYGTMRSYNTICAPYFNDHLLYIGRYSSTKTPEIKGKGNAAIWQFSEKGKIDGIPKPVDLCRFSENVSIDNLKM